MMDEPDPRFRVFRELGGIHACFLMLTLGGSFMASLSWSANSGILFVGAGFLIAAFRPATAVPRLWWTLAVAFLVIPCIGFFPVARLGSHGWRENVENLGLDTGTMPIIQVRQAAEMLVTFSITLFVGLWLAGQRVSSLALRHSALLFALGVVAYALASFVFQEHLSAGFMPGHFGFFPNRNHSATLLAMGAVIGMSCFVQAIRDRRWWSLGLSIIATGICLWAISSWSISRAGILLVAVGTVTWLACLGGRYLGKNASKAMVLLALGATGTFFIADSRLKSRLLETSDAIAAVSSREPDSTSDKGMLAQLQASELRFAIWQDTLDMISAAPWSGHGAGQFAAIFPQYRVRAAVSNDADSYHPESDWLWLAAELGVPAAVAMLALAGSAAWYSFRHMSRGRSRALRAGCLVAALLVAFHGIFDVPGHRIPLAWAAAFLFSLSLPPLEETAARRPAAWPFRIAGIAICLVGIWLIRATWFGGAPPALTAGEQAYHEAMGLLQEDFKRQQTAKAAGETYQPLPGDDLLEKALATLERALQVAPLDRRCRNLQGSIGLNFDDKQALVERAYSLELALDPYWVGAPLRQANTWKLIDPDKTAVLWQESMRRAAWLDQSHPGTHWSARLTAERIRKVAHGHPELEALAPPAP